jgi:hypothetical protein
MSTKRFKGKGLREEPSEVSFKPLAAFATDVQAYVRKRRLDSANGPGD